MAQRLAAALIFFTRLPFHKLWNPPAAAYTRVVELWPLAGWLTAAVTAATLLAASYFFDPLAATATAFAVRALLTGCLHEDGLADWFDGMGGGHSRERILEIMKDSHIGTYGVIALLGYYSLSVSFLSSLPPFIAACIILAADPWSKCCAAQIINRLPYARTAETAKNRTVYTTMSLPARLGVLMAGIIPVAAACLLARSWHPALATLAPVIVTAWAIRKMRHSIGGYTGDCCGATALMAELSFYAAATAQFVF